MHARLPKPGPADLRNEDGVTLIEVLVSILLVGLIVLSFLGLDAAGRTTADQRRVAQATQVAQADQERLRCLSSDQLSTLNQTRNVVLDGVTYTVTSTGTYESGGSGSAGSCSSPAANADYAKVVSTVNWPNNRRNPVVEQSLITPRIGGSLIVQTIDQGAAGISGATVTATGTDSKTNGVVRNGTTDADGCVVFGSLPIGAYSVAASRTGYLDSTGSATPTSTVTTSSGSSTNLTVRLAQPGKISATFRGITGANPTTGYASTAYGMSWINPNMSTAGVLDPVNDNSTPIVTGQTVFPFITTNATTFTNNYTVYAGTCSAAMPPASTNQQSFATVPPNGAATSTTNGQVVVKMPVLNVSVTYAGTARKPANIVLYDSCATTWSPAVAAGTTKPVTGWLASPGVPYGASYYVCADYIYTGTSYRKAIVGPIANTSFTATNGNLVTIAIPNTTTTSNQGTCI